MTPHSPLPPSPAARLFAAAAFAFVLPAASLAQAIWNGGGTDDLWTTGANWSGGTPPIAGNSLTFGGTTRLTPFNDIAADTSFNGVTFSSGAGAFTLAGNRFTLAGGITNSSGSLQTIAGDILVSSSATRAFNGGAGGLEIGGSISTTGTTNGIDVNGGTVTFSGTNAIQSKLAVIGNGRAVITGATTIQSTANQAGNLQLGYHGLGGSSTLDIATGGTLSLLGTTASQKSLGTVGNQRTSTLNVAGGALVVGQNSGFVVGEGNSNGIGTLNVTAGTATITLGTAINVGDTTRMLMGRNGAAGTVNLDGGVLETGRDIVFGGTTIETGSAVFNFNGGTLRALANKSDWMGSATTGSFRALTAVNVKAGGAVIDSNGFNVTINNALLHAGDVPTDGGLTKQGAGTLTLGGASTYNGLTRIEAGTLALAAGASIGATSGVEIGAGAVFDVSAQAEFVMAAGQSFTFTLDGAGTGSAGILNAAGLDIMNATVDFSTLGLLDDDAYILASYTSLTGSAFATVNNLPTGYQLDYDYLGGQQIALFAVPEPGALGLLAGAAGVLIFRRRRARILAF